MIVKAVPVGSLFYGLVRRGVDPLVLLLIFSSHC